MKKLSKNKIDLFDIGLCILVESSKKIFSRKLFNLFYIYIYIWKKNKKIIIRAFNNFIFEEVNTSSQQKLVLVLFFPNGGLLLMLDTK